MPRNCNGYNRDSLDLYKPSHGADEASASELEIFRDFENVPVVVCERIDITPYLHKQRKVSSSPILREPSFVSAHKIPNFGKKCLVQIKRESLEKLKEEFMNYSKRNRKKNSQNVTFKCSICQKVYLNEKKLLTHQENKHVILINPESKIRKKVSFSEEIIVHEVKEYHRCRKCPKIYESYESLKAHMREIHKKRRCYICFYCSKDFIDRTFFKVHMKLHCDSCGLLLPNKKMYNEHRRNVCKMVKRYQCKTCNINLFHFLDLKDHSYEHLGQFYICDICKDRFDDKCALCHHIKFLHSKRRPTKLFSTQTDNNDTVYNCNFCELTSSERNSMDTHVSTFPEYEKCAMTGYNDFYFCDLCFEKFSTETDMLAHKWTHFLTKHDVQEMPTLSSLLDKDVLSTNTNETHNNDNMNDSLQNKTTTSTQSFEKFTKRFYNVNESIPAFLQPRVIVERMALPQLSDFAITEIDDPNNSEVESLIKSTTERKKTVFSKHQCEFCLKYLSTKNSLTRHMYMVHGISKESICPFNNASEGKLHCPACEGNFSQPTLLQNHNCVRINLPEQIFQNARPDVQVNVPPSPVQNGFDDDIISIDEDDEYMNPVDFDIPAPIVELTEYENVNLVINNNAPIQRETAHGEHTVPFNNYHCNGGSNHVTNNDAIFNGQLNNQFSTLLNTSATGSHVQFNGHLHQGLEARGYVNGQVNNAVDHSPPHRINVQLAGKQNQYLIITQEVPIEF